MGQKDTLRHHNAPNEYEAYIIKVLRKEKALAGSILRSMLTATFTLSDDAAKKAMQRCALRGYIKTSSPLTFGLRQYAYMLPETRLNLTLVKAICREHRQSIYRLLEGLEVSDGILSYYEALKLTAATEEKTSTKISSLDQILDLCIKLEICSVVTDNREVKYVLLLENFRQRNEFEISDMTEQHFPRMVRDVMFLPDVIRWLQKSNIIDNYIVRFRNRRKPSMGASINSLNWDAFAFTKTTGLNSIPAAIATTNDKKTLVVLDTVIWRQYEMIDAQGLYNRVQIYLNSVKEGSRKIMPIVVCRNLSQNAADYLRSLGFMCFELSSIFGSRIFEILDKMKKVEEFDSMGEEEIQSAIESTLLAINEIGQDDALRTLKGILFEYLLYPTLRLMFPSAIIRQGVNLFIAETTGKTGHEFDYVIQSSSPTETVIVEAKGYSSENFISLGSTDKKDKGSLKWFFKKALPFATKHLKRSDDGPVKGMIITTADFYQDTAAFIKELNDSSVKPKHYNVAYNGNEMMTLMAGFEEFHAQRIIRDFYLIKKEKE